MLENNFSHLQHVADSRGKPNNVATVDIRCSSSSIFL